MDVLAGRVRGEGGDAKLGWSAGWPAGVPPLRPRAGGEDAARPAAETAAFHLLLTEQLFANLAPRPSGRRVVVVGGETTVQLFTNVVTEGHGLGDLDEAVPNCLHELQPLICWQFQELG